MINDFACSCTISGQKVRIRLTFSMHLLCQRVRLKSASRAAFLLVVQDALAKGHSTSVANRAAKRYSPCVPYLFPYEDLFVYTISLLIVGLLYMRVRYARKRRRDSARPNL